MEPLIGEYLLVDQVGGLKRTDRLTGPEVSYWTNQPPNTLHSVWQSLESISKSYLGEKATFRISV